MLPPTYRRMPPAAVETGSAFRHDILSADVRRVHPDLPDSPGARLRHVAECDARAYETIREELPLFRPPGGGRRANN